MFEGLLDDGEEANFGPMNISFGTAFRWTCSLVFFPALASAQGPLMQQPQDSLDLMTQMWHALPAAEVGQVGLAAGSLDPSEIPGSMQRLSSKMLAKMSYANPMQTLHALAGLNLVEEDGFGLRPNVGMRGSGSERSSRITLMEDGILMAPAPYAAPSAYYFPTMARMESVEVRKGGSQIAFGPQTAGGALNLVSTAIPDEHLAGRVRMETGSFGNQQTHTAIGGQSRAWGYSIEWMQLASDGFKVLDGGGNTGFDKADLVAKLQWTSENGQHLLRGKAMSSEEESRETYLGLFQADFDETPNRRYAASAKDLMTTAHNHFVLGHEWKVSDHVKLTTEAYQTRFERNWYKLDRAVDSLGQKIALGGVLEGGSEEVLGWLRGANTPQGAGLDVKANNRVYGSRGIQQRGRVSWGGERQHRLTFGMRVHEDFMDRYEWRDRYAMDEGNMILMLAGDSGSASNRVESAKALAGHVQAALHWGRLTLTPGLRHERIALSRLDFGDDLQRTGDGALRSNRLNVWLPGLGAHWDLMDDTWTLFAGAHRGFVPPGSSPDTKAEFSLNVELGTRISSPAFSGQATLFYSDHQNLLGADLTASGGTGSGDLFNGGASMARGLELELVTDFLEITGADAFFDGTKHMPVRLSYTLTQAEFTQDFESEFDPWGSVESGDALPYLAPHQFNASISWQGSTWSVDGNVRAMSAMRTLAGQGELLPNQSTDACQVADIMFRWFPGEYVTWFAGATNLTDQTYVVARRPYGLRPAMPRAFRFGATVEF